MIALLALLSSLQGRPADTLQIRTLRSATPPNLTLDSSVLGPAQVHFETGQGWVVVWLFRWRDTVFLRATTPCGLRLPSEVLGSAVVRSP